MAQAPGAARGLRLLGALWVGLLLVWLPFEDTSTRLPAVLGLYLSAWLAVRFWAFWSTLGDVLMAAWVAAGWAASIPLLTLLLMAFKGGVHGHGFPDFAISQFAQVLSVVPMCALVGAGLGAGVYTFIHKK